MVAAFTKTFIVQGGWLGLKVGGDLALSLHSSNKPDELFQWLCHDDSTIKITVVLLLLLKNYFKTVIRAGAL